MDDGSEQKFQWPPLLSLWLSERVHLICDTFHPFHLYLRFFRDRFIIVVAHWTQQQHTPMTFCQRDRSMAPICLVDETMIKVASRCEFFSELLCFANRLFRKIWFSVGCWYNRLEFSDLTFYFLFLTLTFIKHVIFIDLSYSIYHNVLKHI